MNGLVVYYSRTGNTKKIGEIIADLLDFETKEIIDKKDRSGLFGYMKSGWDAWREKRTEIEGKEERDLSDYDLIVIGTPVWAAKPAPAINTYLEDKKGEIKRTAFFCTYKSSGHESTFKKLKNISDLEPADTLAITEDEIKNEDYERDIKKFVERCR